MQQYDDTTVMLLSLVCASVGWFLLYLLHNGYTKSPKVKHPELNNVRAGDPLLVIRFTEQDLKELQERILQQKMDELFEEPSTYEDEDDD